MNQLQPNQFSDLKQTALNFRTEDYKSRIKRLNKIKTWIKNNEPQIIQALHADFNKPEFETQLTEIHPVLAEIHFMIKHLQDWMQDHLVPTPFTLLGHKSFIRYENKGVVLIISPWNYPFYLALAPLVTALATGNTAVIKPSELTAKTSELIQKLVHDCFAENEVLVFTGDKSITEHLLTFQFDHVFFTGSTQVGKIIAKACAEKLIPTTLELGGKSPAVVETTADLNLAAEKIFWGKFLNRGQTCVAPDYALVHESVYEIFCAKLEKLNQKHFSLIEGQIINQNHSDRLSKMIDQSIEQSISLQSQPVFIKKLSSDLDKILNDSSMKEEIFGPVLPVIPFKTEQDLKSIMYHFEKPLAFYIFSENKTFIQKALTAFTSGSCAINTVIVQLANPYLPFGGVGASGLGRYHGWHGFQELSHQRAILHLSTRFQFIRRLSLFIQPPYTNLKKKLIRYL